MADPYVGEIRMFAGNFAPADWAFCDGSLLDISTYDVLFQLIGTTYGGDGASTFALPDLRGRAPVHTGQGNGLSRYVLGQSGGQERVTLTTPQLPSHTHPASASVAAATSGDPGGHTWAATSSPAFGTGPAATLRADALAQAGGSQPHENRPPSLAVSFIIALYGVFPTQA